MTILSFNEQFAQAVVLGLKKQTIRAKGKRKYHVGETLHFYTGGYSQKRKFLGTSIVSKIDNIVIDDNIIINDKILSYNKSLKFIIADGFNGKEDFQKYFFPRGKTVFEGIVIYWEKVRVSSVVKSKQLDLSDLPLFNSH